MDPIEPYVDPIGPYWTLCGPITCAFAVVLDDVCRVDLLLNINKFELMAWLRACLVQKCMPSKAGGASMP